MNGGQCVLDEAASQWFCKCPENLRGRQCQLGVNECKDGMFCMVGGALGGGVKGARAMLRLGTGTLPVPQSPPQARPKQAVTSPPQPPQNNGGCSDDGAKCVCPPGFFGLHCQNNERDPYADLIPRKSLPPWASALIALASLIAVTAIAGLAVLIVRERRGRPVFKTWEHNASGLQGTL